MKKRILVIGFCLTALALILFSVVSAVVYYRASLSYVEETLVGYLGAFDEETDRDGLTEEYASALSERLNGVRVTFLALDGSFLADSEDEEEESRADRPEVEEAIASGEGFDARSSRTLDKSMIYYCKAFPQQGYLVRLSVATDSLWGIYLRSLPALFVLLVADLCVNLLISYCLTGYILRPVEQLARDASCEKHVETDCEELKTVADILNALNADAAARMKELDDEKKLVVKAQQSKDEFIANITHEMNTPLTSVKGFAELLSSGALEGEREKHAAATILAQSERLTKLIACIINYNEIDSEDLPTYDVNASKVLEETLELLMPAVNEHKLVLLKNIEPNVILCSRQERVAEIAGNLIRNAIRYNREGGSIAVLLTADELSVSDTGIGIAEENLDRIFDRFFTVDKAHNGKNGGFGLGLSIVKKLCDKAGWELSVRSKLGEGTVFTVRFHKNT